MSFTPRRRLNGLTLVELLVALAVVGVLVALVAPSFKHLVASQRLKGVNAQMVTDLNFARSEAVRLNQWAFVQFETTDALTCYTVYSKTSMVSAPCKCSKGAGLACPAGGGTNEIKTVSLPTSTGMSLSAVNNLGAAETVYNERGLPNFESFTVDVTAAGVGQLRTSVNVVGRITVCSPDQKLSGVPPC